MFKARDPLLDRFVAIKLISETRHSDTSSKARFLQEARALSALNHPNIVTVHEIGEQDGQTFIVMELVNGKPLHEIIPAKGMRLPDVLRISVQIAEALSAAHAARIVHRDLKPANIMVDSNGRVKVLDFGLAKLLPVVNSNEATLTMASAEPLSDDGTIIGSVPYMSPEQAEGKPVDARSDIFSFGAVVYEMVTGRRAFRGESTVSTLAAIIERDPPSVREINSNTPIEIERLIIRCLRKDLNRRSQNMADVKLTLEEIRVDSESGRLNSLAVTPKLSRRGSMQFIASGAILAVTAAGVSWFYRNHESSQSRLPTMLRVSPDDGHSYSMPAVSPDGAFVAFVSDRSGRDQLWLQQVESGAPIQLTHSEDGIAFPAFFPDGKRIVYVSGSEEELRGRVEVISTLGGGARTLVEGGYMINWAPPISPDGRELAFYEKRGNDVRLIIVSSDGGEPRELKEFSRLGSPYYGRAAWTPDNRHLICYGLNRVRPAADLDWFVLPVDGSAAWSTGALEELTASGFAMGSLPMVITRDRALFVPGNVNENLWEIAMTPGSWRVHGSPVQITSGTQSYEPYSVDNKGVVATTVSNTSKDLYLLPLSPTNGEPTASVQRLTRDQRGKDIAVVGGGLEKAYFLVSETVEGFAEWRVWELDIVTRKQRVAFYGIPLSALNMTISPDGRQIAYCLQAGQSRTLYIAGTNAKLQNARILCRGCFPYQFSPDGRFILYRADTNHPDNPQKVISLLDISTGQSKSWIESESESIHIIGQTPGRANWIMLSVQPISSAGPEQRYMVPWHEQAVPKSAWIEMPPGSKNQKAVQWHASPSNSFFYGFQGSKLMSVNFNPRKAHFGEPRELRVPNGTEPSPKPRDQLVVMEQGLVFSREINGNSEVWLMKLPR